jgi:hypothetical protein
MSDASRDSPPQKERLFVAVVIGFFAGLIGSLVGVVLNPHDWTSTILVYAIPSAISGALAVQFAPSRLLEVWGLLCVGIPVGVFVSVVVHPTVGGGERNLWPFEIVMFLVLGLIPMWLGILTGRLVRLRTGSPPTPSNNRWRGP